MYDLIVIGGGPAGSSAAITAARAGFRVLLVERGSFPRHKVCGEFVSAESLALLTSLLAGDAPSTNLLTQSPRIALGRLFVDNSVLETPIDPPAASIARFELDDSLWKAAERGGVDARQQTTVDMIRRDGHFGVKTTSGSFEGRAVINGSGRWSNLSPRVAESSNSGQAKWLGLKAHFFETEPSPSVDLYFFKGGYCGVQPLSDRSEYSSLELRPPPSVTCGTTDTVPFQEIRHDNRPRRAINACAMVRADAANSLPEVFSRHPQLKKRSAAWSPITEPVATSPLLFRKPASERDGVLLAGDAAGFVDPFVGDGISLALRSGVMAAQSLLPFLAGDISHEAAVHLYAQSYNQRLAPVFRTSSKIRRLFALPRPVRAGLLVLFESAPGLTRYLMGKTR
jgi:flavin-dependent dehydrogenase